MLLSNFPVVIDPAVGVLEVSLRPETAHIPAGKASPGSWSQLHRLQVRADVFPSLGGDAVHYFGRNPTEPARNPFVLVYDANGVWRYLMVKESPEHPWSVERVPEEVTGDLPLKPSVRVVFDSPLHCGNAGALLKKLVDEGLSESDCWNLIRALRQAKAVVSLEVAGEGVIS